MSDSQNRPAWMNDELVQNIPQEKLDILNEMFSEANKRKSASGRKLSQKELLLQFMPLLKQIKAANLNFTPQEMQAAIAAIKKHSSAEELEEINKILKNPKL